MFPAKHFFLQQQHMREANSSVVMNPQCFKVPDSYWAASGLDCRHLEQMLLRADADLRRPSE